MIFRKLFRWLRGESKQSVSSSRSSSSRSPRSRSLSSKTYGRRYAETEVLSDVELDSLITEREAEGLLCGVAYHNRANRAAARVRAGGKAYGQRYAETSGRSTGDLQALRAQRVTAGLPVGVIDRVLGERTS